MECKNCGEEMKLTATYGDGYTEPREDDFYCEECDLSCNVNQAFGVEWSDE